MSKKLTPEQINKAHQEWMANHTQEEIDAVFCPEEESKGDKVVREFSEAFDRILDDFLGKDYKPPVKDEQNTK